jgi:hypothetical protein
LSSDPKNRSLAASLHFSGAPNGGGSGGSDAVLSRILLNALENKVDGSFLLRCESYSFHLSSGDLGAGK